MYKYYLIIAFFGISIFQISAQTTSKIKSLIPKQILNTQETISPMPPFMVRVEFSGDIIETEACQKESIAYGGLKTEISWYNNNDETGKMMLGMMSNKADIEEKWASHKSQLEQIHELYKKGRYGDGFKFTDVKEEIVNGGKIFWISATNQNCDTEKARSQIVNAMCFYFNGTAHGEISIETHNSPDEVREMIQTIIKNTNEFNFSKLL